VHTKRNLRALENQKISLNRKAQQQQQQESQQQQTQPQFEHTLLLGHVSMLTAICVGTERVVVEGGADGAVREREREYIITADRDEHIRVTRGMPQAHVIEGFCLGHEEFVSRLCVGPGGRQEILVSGGGDDDLFVWDWAKGRLLGRAGVLEHVKGVVGESVSKVAVTRLLGCLWKGRACVFVALERYVCLAPSLLGLSRH
jgi:tRNA (guanine-N(7)-)-methyltransferase subunit TRM82